MRKRTPERSGSTARIERTGRYTRSQCAGSGWLCPARAGSSGPGRIDQVGELRPESRPSRFAECGKLVVNQRVGNLMLFPSPAPKYPLKINILNGPCLFLGPLWGENGVCLFGLRFVCIREKAGVVIKSCLDRRVPQLGADKIYVDSSR